jgi:hypothetical protein
MVNPELVWGLVPRFVGLLYVLAFGALIPQLEAVIGTRGLAAIGPRLQAAKRDFPGAQRFFKFPTLLWINHSDGLIRALPWIGVGLGLWLIYGGPYATIALVAAWLLWLSLEPGAIIFPWDTMLQEAGFLCLFLPTVQPLPALEATHLPWPSVTFLFRWFVLRLMLGFGKLKFIGSKREDSLYLRGFFVWMPSPSPLAFFGHHLPAWLLRIMLYFMFAAEVIAPMLGLFAGIPRLISYAMLASLMIGIHASGNWGFFNVGYILLLTCLLDSNASIFDLGQEPWASQLSLWPNQLLHVLLGVLFLTSVIYLVVLDSWTMRTLIHWPLDALTYNRRWLRALIAYLRAIGPFRIVNGYGVFPPGAVAPVRNIPVFEGSNDGVNWLAYRYRHMATRAHDRGEFLAPYQARIDMAVCYSAAGVYDASYYGSLIGDGTPYTAYTRSSWLDRLCQRLLVGEPLILRQLAHNPFPDAPPKWVRVSVVAMTPCTPAVRRATGAWWHTRPVGVFLPATQKAEWPDALMVPEPEVFHPDWVDYKRRSAQLSAMAAAYDGGMEPDQAVLVATDLTADDVRAFWQELVPMLWEGRGDFARYDERSAVLAQRYDKLQLARFERVLSRFVWLLRRRTERHQFAKLEPILPIAGNFRYELFLQSVVLDGRDACLKLLAEPSTAAERHARSSDAEQLWGLAMLRRDLTLQHVCAYRWTNIGREHYDLKLPGLAEYFPLLSAIVPPGEEFRQVINKLPNGEHTIEDFYPPPALA